MSNSDPEPKLRVVDEETGRQAGDVVRLETGETGGHEPEVVLRQPAPEAAPRRLESQEKHALGGRTHQPGVEAILEHEAAGVTTESQWGTLGRQVRSVPYGWFILILLLMAGAGVWAFRSVTAGEKQVAARQTEVKAIDDNDAASEAEARQQVERVESVIRGFFQARTVEELLPFIRSPERVGPLIREYVKDTPLVPVNILAIVDFRPGIIEGRNIWLVRVRKEDNKGSIVAVEILDDGSAKVDWETLVSHQPIPWARYISERPSGKSMDFRVIAEPDLHFSHEFADESQWRSYRLTVRGDDDYLFGYARVGSEEARLLDDLHSRSGRATIILRLRIPPGTKAPRGVVIEKVVAPRWLYVTDPPAQDGP